MEQPLLRLGMLGFTEPECRRVSQLLTPVGPGWPHWELGEFEQTDAWIVNGHRVDSLDDNRVRVHTLLQRQPSIILEPNAMTRPVAFTQPMPAGLQATEVANIQDPVVFRTSLQRFEAWLRPLRAQFALGAELVVREHDLSPGIYQVIDTQGRMLAVLDLIKWRVGILPNARPIDFKDAKWVPRPSMAGDMPPGFSQLNVAQLMWTYADRTVSDVLPARYRKNPIFLRRLPNLPADWVRDEHLLILRALSVRAGNLEQLGEETGLPQKQLAHCLASLYFVGTITTNAKAALQMQGKPDKAGPVSKPASPPRGQTTDSQASDFHSTLPPVQLRHHASPTAKSDATAPVPLFKF